MSAPTPEFQLELVKVLLAIAWADHRIVRTEADMIRDVARKLGVDAWGMTQIEVWLSKEADLPKPNLELLKQHKRAVLATVRTLVMADNRIAPEEAVMVKEIEAALE